MVSFVVNRSLKLFSKDDPFFSSLSMSAEEENIDLGKLKYMFALENIDSRIGRLKVEQTFWGTSQEPRETKAIELVDCNDFLPGGAHEGE